MPKPPKVKVYLESVGAAGWVWVVPRCPRCGDPEAHSAGKLDEDPRDYLGRDQFICRLSHPPATDCTLVEMDPAHTDRTVARVRAREERRRAHRREAA